MPEAGNLLPGVAALVIMLVVHELGHYWAARLCGVRVATVSLGFGREVASWTDRHGTRWRLSAAPIGGYVRMADPQGGGGFDHRHLPVRVWIMLAGPLANFVLTTLTLAILFMTVGERVGSTEITDVLPDGPAANAGIRQADRIVAIGGAPIRRFEDVDDALRSRAGMPTNIDLERGTQHLRVSLVPQAIAIERRLGHPLRRVRIGVWHKRWPFTAPDAVVEFERRSPAEAAWHALKTTVRSIGKPFGLLWKQLDYLPSHDALAAAKPPRAPEDDENGLDKIVTIARYTLADAAYFMAFGSITFGLFNLLPMPPLDGWNIAAYVAASLRDRRRRTG